MSINMKRSSIFGLAALALLSAVPVMAQKTMDDMQYLTINENVTTVITASEPVRFVDISTDKVAGDQPISNLVRLKLPLSRNATAASTLLFTPPAWTRL